MYYYFAIMLLLLPLRLILLLLLSLISYYYFCYSSVINIITFSFFLVRGPFRPEGIPFGRFLTLRCCKLKE